MPSTEKLDTHHKALTVNLDPSTFGSFAEIGAGQEVARWFLVVGGASGTVAKTISAYDKEVSDDLYSSGSRQVSKSGSRWVLDIVRVAAWPRILAHQDLVQRRLNPIHLFADDSDRLLVFYRVGQGSDSFQSIADLVIARPNEVEPCAPLLTIPVSMGNEPDSEPGKNQTEQSLDRNAIGRTVKL